MKKSHVTINKEKMVAKFNFKAKSNKQVQYTLGNKDIVKELGGEAAVSKATWINIPKGSPTTSTKLERVISFKDLGFADKPGNLIFKATNTGEKVANE